MAWHWQKQRLPCSRLQCMAWLGQQYALDMFYRLEEERLQYVDTRQDRLSRGNVA